MALFGSDVEKNIKKASAETEEAWIGAGESVGLQIWRIEVGLSIPAHPVWPRNYIPWFGY